MKKMQEKINPQQFLIDFFLHFLQFSHFNHFCRRSKQIVEQSTRIFLLIKVHILCHDSEVITYHSAVITYHSITLEYHRTYDELLECYYQDFQGGTEVFRPMGVFENVVLGHLFKIIHGAQMGRWDNNRWKTLAFISSGRSSTKNFRMAPFAESRQSR